MRNSKTNGLRKINSEQSSHILSCNFICLLLQCMPLLRDLWIWTVLHQTCY